MLGIQKNKDSRGGLSNETKWKFVKILWGQGKIDWKSSAQQKKIISSTWGSGYFFCLEKPNNKKGIFI